VKRQPAVLVGPQATPSGKAWMSDWIMDGGGDSSSSWGDVSAEEREGRWLAVAASEERARGSPRQARQKAKKSFAESLLKNILLPKTSFPCLRKYFFFSLSLIFLAENFEAGESK